jgi:hypothetical protein
MKIHVIKTIEMFHCSQVMQGGYWKFSYDFDD